MSSPRISGEVLPVSPLAFPFAFTKGVVLGLARCVEGIVSFDPHPDAEVPPPAMRDASAAIKGLKAWVKHS